MPGSKESPYRYGRAAKVSIVIRQGNAKTLRRGMFKIKNGLSAVHSVSNAVKTPRFPQMALTKRKGSHTTKKKKAKKRSRLPEFSRMHLGFEPDAGVEPATLRLRVSRSTD